ncbi:MAG: helix-turn-helix domain-containing protein [Clostridiales bacterium]|nr:helix-turn-helix domain-containing protein [Clostridiales bacterium]
MDDNSIKKNCENIRSDKEHIKTAKENINIQSERERIRQLRENLGLRRTEFGAKIGYTYQQVVRIEEGLTPVSNEVRSRICREYRVSEEWLQEGDDDGIPQDESSLERRKRLRQAYKESGLSQREFSRQTHTSLSMLSDVMTGKRQMTIRYAKKIEEALGIGADWILYGDESAKNCPCTDAMIRFIKKHPEIRTEIYEKMKEEKAKES